MAAKIYQPELEKDSQNEEGIEDEENQGYFNSYNDLEVHELMLKDRPRTVAYRSFFETNRHLVKDKVVMDVGAGTGILSLFAAAAGAKKVYAVEASDVATLCQEVVDDNGFSDIITVINGAVENIDLDTEVDVIVSEWMGFYLLHESMLDSVIVARDRFLAPGGLMAPSHARIYFAPVDMSEHFKNRADEWSNVHGFDFSPIASALNVAEVSKPLVQCLAPETLQAEPKVLLDLDLKTVTQEEVGHFVSKLEFHIQQDTRVHGFACWFDVDFSIKCAADKQLQEKDVDHYIDEKGDHAQACTTDKIAASVASFPSADVGQHFLGGDLVTTCKNHKYVNDNDRHAPAETVYLKTGPYDPPTHWKQTVIFLPQTIALSAGTDLCCRVTMAQDTSNNKRHYNITVALTDDDGDDADEDSEEEEEEDHPVPCHCGLARCQLIAALVEKYGAEHDELGDEAEMLEVHAQVEAAQQIDQAIEQEGWPMDASSSGAKMQASDGDEEA